MNLRKSAVFCENLRFGRSLSPEFRHLKLALKYRRTAIILGELSVAWISRPSTPACPRDKLRLSLFVPGQTGLQLCTVIFEIITFLIQKHFKTVTVTVILRKLIQMTFQTVIGSQWK